MGFVGWLEMGNLPLCISKQERAVMGEYSEHRGSLMVQPFRSVSDSPEPLALGHVFCGGDGDYGGDDMWRVEEEEEEEGEEEEKEEVVEKRDGENDGLCWSIGYEAEVKEDMEEEEVGGIARVVGEGMEDVILGLELQQDSVSLCTDAYVHRQ